jgi:hypothetical protein
LRQAKEHSLSRVHIFEMDSDLQSRHVAREVLSPWAILRSFEMFADSLLMRENPLSLE